MDKEAKEKIEELESAVNTLFSLVEKLYCNLYPMTHLQWKIEVLNHIGNNMGDCIEKHRDSRKPEGDV